MIAAIADLFVERVPVGPTRAALAPAERLLIVDACGRQRKVAELARAVERGAPVAATVVAFEELSGLPDGAAFDAIWLLADSDSDLAYCELVTRELGDAFGVPAVRVVAVGNAPGLASAVTIDPAAAGAAPPWRRTREARRGAAAMIESLLGPGKLAC